MKIIAIASLKGGCSKSTVSLMLANCLPGKKLLVDLDHNNNSTDVALRDMDPADILATNIYQVLTGKIKLPAAIFRSEFGSGFDIVPAAPSLSRLSVECAGNPGVMLRFKSALKKLDYDFIVIDTHPALAMELRLALHVADYVLCPAQLGRWTLQGFDLVQDEVELARQETEDENMILKVLPSIVSESEIATLRDLLGEDVPFTNAHIPNIKALKNIQNTGIAPKLGTKASEAFETLAAEIVSWGEVHAN